jgi:glucoside 3-dehydrogenase (cytochrome c) hitch-hiker subunit
MDGLNRRQALQALAAGAIGAATSAIWVESLSALARQQAHAHAADAVIALQEWTLRVLTARQNEAVVTLTELIIPQTDTPGAKAARVNRFIDAVLHDARPADRDSFLRGLAWMDERSRALFGKDFLGATAAEQTALLTRLSKEGNPDGEDRIGIEFFQAIKSMTINGYYTTEIGLRQELGDDGQLFLGQFLGCTHPEHQG